MNNLLELKTSISDAIERIKEGKVTPKKSGIAKMFNDIQYLSPSTHAELLAEYKPVSNEFFALRELEKKSEKLKRKVILCATEKNIQSIEKNISFDEDDFDENGELLRSVWNKTMEDASTRIEGKKKKVPTPASNPNVPKLRDRIGYVFNDNLYGKGPLVLAIVKWHVCKNPGIKHDELKIAFPDALLKNYGIFKMLDVAQEASKKRKRYFLKDDQIISIGDGHVAVCNQFTSDNIGAFIKKAQEMGYKITDENA